MSPTKSWAWGLFQKRERWTLTWKGLAAFLIIVSSILVIAARNVCSFLAAATPQGKGILVVEGWLPDYALRSSIDLFHSNRYERVLVPGTRLSVGSYLADYKDYARLGEASLKKMGLPAESVVAIDPPDVHRDRTYASGLAVKQWITMNCPSVKSIDVVSLAVHTRRTRLLYQKAFGADYKVGGIPIRDMDYDPERWWRTSAGFRTVTSEAMAYFYARFLFHTSNRGA